MGVAPYSGKVSFSKYMTQLYQTSLQTAAVNTPSLNLNAYYLISSFDF